MKRFLKGLGIFLALISVGVVSAFAVVVLLLRQEEVRVPDLTGQEIVTALDIVTQQGLQLKVERREPNPTLQRDMIISQNPAAGGPIKKGRQVRVVVSLGPADTQAPKVIGESYRKADLIIRQAGFSPGNIARVSSDTVERDVVIAQSPEAGSPLDRGGRINLLVSTGKKVLPYVMPTLVGKRGDEAVRIVDRMGLQYRLSSRAVTDKAAAPSRTVIAQKPAAGGPVTADAMVEIVVSK